MALHILSAGAAQGVVTALKQPFLAATGNEIQSSFGAVGAMKEKFFAGSPCDVIVLTAALIGDLTQAGELIANTGAALGRVRTGIAIRSGDKVPDISGRSSFKASLLNAQGIYFPDPERATAGIHFVNVLKQLGVHDEIKPRLRPYPNGAAAMREMAKTVASGLLGCTQITEINYTEGVSLVGPLPAEFELATVYCAAVCSKAREPDLARQFVELLTGPRSQALRAQGGFEL